MATTITAGNSTNGGAAISSDNTGILELKTGTGSGTTGLTINASQNTTLAGTLSAGAITSSGLVTGATGALYPIVLGTSISTATTSFTGATSGASTTLTASSVTGTIQVGQVIAGTNIVAGTSIIAQVSGTTGGAGTYTLSQASSGTVSGTITVVGVDFYNIPSWAKRVTVMLNGVSTNGTSFNQIQIGSGSITTSGYASQFWTGSSTSGVITTGFGVFSLGGAGNSLSGSVVFTNITGNTWVSNGLLIYPNTSSNGWSSAGVSPALGGTLDRVRITTVNGTDQFDAGTINIMWE